MLSLDAINKLFDHYCNQTPEQQLQSYKKSCARMTLGKIKVNRAVLATLKSGEVIIGMYVDNGQLLGCQIHTAVRPKAYMKPTKGELIFLGSIQETFDYLVDNWIDPVTR